MKLRSMLLVGLMAVLAGFLAVPVANATDGKPPPTTTSGTPWEDLFSIKNPPRTLTVDEMRRMMGAPVVHDAILIATTRTEDIPWQDMDRLLAGETVPGVWLARVVAYPPPDTTVGDLAGAAPVSEARGHKVKVRYKIVYKCKGTPQECPFPTIPS